MAAPRRRKPRRGDSVGQWIQALPQGFIECRDLGHIWRPYRAWWDNDAKAYRRAMRCPRCFTERVQLLSASGAILSGHYVYAEGYSKPEGTGTLDADGRATLRLETTLRLVDETASDTARIRLAQ